VTFFKFGARWSWVVSATPGILTSGKKPRHTLNRKLGGPQKPVQACEENYIGYGTINVLCLGDQHFTNVCPCVENQSYGYEYAGQVKVNAEKVCGYEAVVRHQYGGNAYSTFTDKNVPLSSKKVKQSHYRRWWFQEVQASILQDSRYMKVVNLIALCIGRLYPPGNITETHYFQRLKQRCPTKHLVYIFQTKRHRIPVLQSN
jgi:hypothetical protein